MGNGRQFGKYQLIAHLATGGMAEVLLASQSSLAGFEKLIVIKRILPHLSREPKFIDMFLDEARIAALLNHPNVVQVFDLGRVMGRYFIAMEYLPGESLSSVIRTCRRRGAAVPPHLAAGFIVQASDGLHHAHQAVGKDGKPLDIVHRDVSPQNVFVLYDGGVKVVDFGIAKAALRSTHTRTGTLKGKYPYMSPEQILAEEVDARSDVFSLGVVLWECLTGRKLFPQKSELKLMQAITDGEKESPVELNPDVPLDLADITMKALARDPGERYQSAAELREVLSESLRVASASADNASIARFMHSLFADRIKEKRRLIESAQESSRDLREFLFGDMTELMSDTEPSVPGSPVEGLYAGGTGISMPGSAADVVVERPPEVQRRPLLWMGVGGILAVAIVAALFVFLGPQDTGKNRGNDTDPNGAGAVIPAGPVSNPDAGPLGKTPEPVDAGTVVAASDPGRVTEPASRASSVDPKPDLPRSDRAKKRRKRRRKVAQANPGEPKPPGEQPVSKDPPAQGGTGTLRLTTDPWTEIYLNGRKLGETPLVDLELPAGKHRMRAVNKDAGIDQSITIRIQAGKRVVKRFNFF